MKMIGKNSLRVLSAAMLIGTVTLGVPGIAKEVYPGVNVPDEVYKTEYGDKENYSEIKYYKWQTNEAGIKVLGEGTKEDNDLKYYVSSRKENVSDISGVISGNQDASDPVTISEKGDYNGIWVDNSEAQVLGEQTPFFSRKYTGGSALVNRVQDTDGINISGAFANNHMLNIAPSANVSGGVLYNPEGANINNLIADFVANTNEKNDSQNSIIMVGALLNIGNINNIEGNFIANKIINDKGGYCGNAGSSIANQGTIKSIKGDFLYNITEITGPSNANGTLYNEGSIGSVKGDFIGNKINSQTNMVLGGAISNQGNITNLQSNFIENNIKSNTGNALGGAIYNNKDATIANITGDFIGNTATSSSNYARGGAIYNAGTIGEIHGSFINNYTSGQGETFGGVIFNVGGEITEIKGDFIGNRLDSTATLRGVAIYNYNQSHIGNIEGSFIGNVGNNTGKFYTMGGAITNTSNSVIDSIKSNFVQNTLIGSINNVLGGAILNNVNSTIKYIEGDFVENSVTTGDAVASGGGIWTSVTIGEIVNSNFIGNYAKTSTDGEAKGGAIYSSSSLNIIVDNGVSTFSGNYTQVGEEVDDNAIYIDNAESSLNFQLKNGGSIVMKDNIRGLVSTTTETLEDGTEREVEKHYSVNITGDDIKKTTFYMHNDIYDANVTLGNTTINTINDNVHNYNFHSLTLTGDTNIAVDVDLAKGEMDRFSANEYGEHKGNLNVIGMNLLSDANKEVTEIYFAENGLKDKVINGIKELPQKSYQTTAYTPIYTYNVKYDTTTDYGKGEGGYFLFTKGDKIFTGNGGSTTPSGNPSDAFNPSVLSAPVSSVAASQATINETFKYVFEHADSFTQMPSRVRQSKLNANKYALSTDFNHNLGSLCPEHNNKAGWYKPYVTFENMNLKQGPKVDAITYGSLVGFDTDFRELKHGWHSVGTGYIGYNGSQLNYSGVDTTMNGGLVGYTETFYKKNFWSALTLSAGASVGESRTMYGKEDFTSLMAGVGSKTGYNFEFKEGKYILQPIMFLSYSFVNTFDYTNAAGVKIKPSPAHSIQLNPSVRFVANTKNGWQPYASVGMVWNLMNENKVTANNVRLPEMGMKPYVEYGIGLQRNWKDKFTAYGQAMIRNGGRNGIALSGGMRWALGKEGKPTNEKVQNGQKVVLKQLNEAQKTALGKKQNTTRTTNAAVLKSL